MSVFEPDKANSATPSHPKRTESFYFQSMAIALALLPLVGYIAPRTLAFLPGLIGLIGFFVGWYIFKKRPYLHTGSLYIVLPLLCLALISVVWAVDPEESLERVLKITPVLISGVALFSVLQSYGALLLPLFTKVFPCVALLAAALALIDLLGNGAFYTLFQSIPANDSFNASELNRGIIVVLLSFIPAYALILPDQNFWSAKRLRVYVFLALSIIAGILLTTDSQSAHLIIVLCVFFWMGFPVSKTKSWYGLLALLTGLLLAAPWFAQYMFDTLPPLIEGVEWFKQSYALNRLEIWDYVGRYIETSPLYGFGIEATRSIEDFDSAYLYDDKATILHPHNFALQLWIEFGVIGAAFGALAMGYILKKIKHMDNNCARLSLTVFIGLLCPAATAYGMWQGWFIGLFFMIAAFCLIVMQRPVREI